VIQFPEATNFMNSMFQFLRTAMNSAVFESDIIHALLPILVLLEEGQERTPIVASSRQFLADLAVTRTGNRELDHVLLTNVKDRECLNRYLRKYVENLRIPYGGPVSRDATAPSSIRDLLKRKLKGDSILSEEIDGVGVILGIKTVLFKRFFDHFISGMSQISGEDSDADPMDLEPEPPTSPAHQSEPPVSKGDCSSPQDCAATWFSIPQPPFSTKNDSSATKSDESSIAITRKKSINMTTLTLTIRFTIQKHTPIIVELKHFC
jgi:hypothetical protein